MDESRFVTLYFDDGLAVFKVDGPYASYDEAVGGIPVCLPGTYREAEVIPTRPALGRVDRQDGRIELVRQTDSWVEGFFVKSETLANQLVEISR